jgi:hypothetical protein
VGQHVAQGPLGEGAVADLAAGLAAQGLGLAGAERGEVVVEQEVAVDVAADGVEALDVLLGAEGGGDDRLGLAALEQRGAVRAGQRMGLDVDRADVAGAAAVDALALLDHALADDLLLELREGARDLDTAGRVVGEELGGDGLGGDVDRLAALGLADDGEGGPHVALGGGHDGAAEVLVDGGLDVDALGLAGALTQAILQGDQGGGGLLGEHEGVDHVGLGRLVGAALDHDDRVAADGDDDDDVGDLDLVPRGEGDELALHAGDADAGDRAGPRGLADHQGRGGAGDRQDVGLVHLVVREHGADDLGVVAVALGEERPDRAVDEATGQGLLIGETTLALEVTAGDLAGGGVVLAVLDGEREEGQILRLALRHRGDEDGRLAAADDDGIGLLGELAGLNADLDLADRAALGDCVHGGGCFPPWEEFVRDGGLACALRHVDPTASRPWLGARRPQKRTAERAAKRTRETNKGAVRRPCGVSLADVERADQGAVAVDAATTEVVEEATALADQLEQATTRVEVLRVGPKVLGEVVDAGGQQRDLNFGRTGVAFVGLELADNLGLAIDRKGHVDS